MMISLKTLQFRRIPDLFILVSIFANHAIGDASQKLQFPKKEEFLECASSKLAPPGDLLQLYTFNLLETRRELDAEGKILDSTVKVYEVFPNPLEKLTYRRLLSVNGQLLSTQKLQEQDQLQKKRIKKIRNRRKQQKESRRMRAIQEVFRIFHFEFQAREKIGKYQTIRFGFEKKPGLNPRDWDLKMLTKFRGTAWIDESQCELVQLDAELLDTVSYGFGIAARLYEGTRIFLKRRQINAEIWMVEKSIFRMFSRVMLLKTLRFEVLSQYSNFQKHNHNGLNAR